jgi:GH35 family endo-1,4-beta-xylanase
MNTTVQANIERYRKGDAKFEIVDENGVPVSNAKVTVKQKTHEFKYGANIFMLDELETDEKNQVYKDAFKQIFNIATIPFYWSDLEPEQGKPRYAVDSPKIYRRPPIDLCVNYCLENGIEPKAHCLNYDNFKPEWLKDADVPTYKRALDKRFRELAERYADIIPSWEVTNETLILNSNGMHFSKFYYEDDFVEWSFLTASITWTGLSA